MHKIEDLFSGGVGKDVKTFLLRIAAEEVAKVESQFSLAYTRTVSKLALVAGIDPLTLADDIFNVIVTAHEVLFKVTPELYKSPDSVDHYSEIKQAVVDIIQETSNEFNKLTDDHLARKAAAKEGK